MANKIFGDVLDTNKWGATSDLVSNKDYVGVEIELEGVSYGEVNRGNSRLHLWSVVEDGSLRNGCEFIFKEPTKGRLIVSALDNLERWIGDNRGIHASRRCGVHVHLDIKDISPQELLNLIMIYIMVERVLFDYVNPTRIKNNYCRPLTDSTFKQTMHELINLSKSDDPIQRIIQYVNDSCEKYAGLNLRPIASFGSIEFRMHQGTTEIRSLVHWINIILSLKNVAREMSVEQLLEASASSLDKLNACIFGGTTLATLTPERSSLLLKGIRDVEETLMYDSLEKTSKILRSKKTKAVVGNRLVDKFIKNLTNPSVNPLLSEGN